VSPSKRQKRLIPIDKFQVLCASRPQQVWLNLHVHNAELDRLGLSEEKALSEGDLATEFEIVGDPSRGDLMGTSWRQRFLIGGQQARDHLSSHSRSRWLSIVPS